jgi:hypothetical protein
MLLRTAYSSAGQFRNDGSTTFTRASDVGPSAVTQCHSGPRQPSTSAIASAPAHSSPSGMAHAPSPRPAISRSRTYSTMRRGERGTDGTHSSHPSSTQSSALYPACYEPPGMPARCRKPARRSTALPTVPPTMTPTNLLIGPQSQNRVADGRTRRHNGVYEIRPTGQPRPQRVRTGHPTCASALKLSVSTIDRHSASTAIRNAR